MKINLVSKVLIYARGVVNLRSRQMVLQKYFPLFVYGVFKFLFLMLFALSVGNASAASPQSNQCSGEDLLVQLAVNAPDALKSIQNQAQKIKYGNARLWKVSREGVRDSWVFGTMHSADKRISVLPAGAREAFVGSKTLLVEIAEILDAKDAQAQLIELKHLTFRLDGTTIEQDLTSKQLQRLRVETELRNMPYDLAIRMQPWMLGPAIGSQLCELAAKAKGELFLDALITKQARTRGMDVVGLETVKEQFTIISSMPKSMQVEALIETLEMGERLNDIKETMKHLYISGEIAMITPMIRHFSNRFDVTAGSEEFQQKIVIDRNINMVTRAQEHFAKGGVFMAIGALHLPGEEGVVALLEKQGYSVLAVKTPID